MKPLGDDPLALNIVREAGYVSNGGMANFGVPGTEFTQTYVPFGDKVQKIQEGILRRWGRRPGAIGARFRQPLNSLL